MMPVVWVLLLGAVHAGAPYSLSFQGRRHLWRAGYPAPLNYVGLIGVVGGALIILWVLLQHFERSPQGMRMGNPFEGPGYVITAGPYGFSRHPMHLAGMAIWFGWALFYGSVAVAIGAVLLSLVFVALVPSEERGIETKLGEEYRRYRSQVPRWLGFPNHPAK